MAFDWPMAAAGTVGGGILPGVGAGFMGGGMKNPAAGMGKGYQDMIAVLQQMLAPYIGGGQNVLPGLQEQYGQLVNDPGSMLAKWGAGYKESPGYKHRQYEGQQAAQNAMAAGGMSGSPMHQEYAAKISEDIANQDFNDYMAQVLGAYGLGLGGQERFAERGYGASRGLGEDIISILSQQMMANFMGKQAQGKSKQDMMNALLQMFGNLGQAGGRMAGAGGFF
jgi:hypothetical protein